MQVEVKTNLSRALELPEMRKEIIQLYRHLFVLVRCSSTG